MEICEVKPRELSLLGKSIRLKYGGKNEANLLSNVDFFEISKKGNLIFLEVKLGSASMVKIIPNTSYNI